MKSFCLQLNRRALLAFLMALCVAIPAFAQKITVQGTVIDNTNGEAIIGANVIAKGDVTGSSTDFDGKFTISVDKNATLVVSYVGYETQEVAVNGQESLTIRLKESSVVLDEVVAIGYGTVKKSDATGSVSMLKPDEIEAGLATSAQDLLVGKSPGVVVTSGGGDPQAGATIRIRGGASLNASNDPLIVIDGVPIDNMSVQGMSNPLAMVSPDNVESMTVLKDASATAIYGSRASNGVIIITTKKGQKGKPQVNFSANMYVNTPRNTVNVLSADAFRNAITNYWGAESAAVKALGNSRTNWQDEVLRTTISHDYNLSVGGTAGILPYRASVSYTKNNGTVKNSSMDRLTAGINLTPKFFDNHLSVQLNAKGYYFRNQFVDAGGAVSSALTMDPTQSVYSDYRMSSDSDAKLYNGYFTINNSGAFESNAPINPIAIINSRDNYADVLRSNGNLQLDYAFHFLPDLHANLNLGYDWSQTKEHNNLAENSPESWKINEKNGAAVNKYTYELKQNTLLDFYLNYKKEVKDIESNFDVTAGYSWQHFKNRGWNDNGIFASNGFDTPKLNADGTYTLKRLTTDIIGKTVNNQPIIPWVNELQLLSFFGRFNYSFKDTYLLTVTVRGDASSRFSKENRWGVFPAAALAWKIDNMDFFKDAKDTMNEFKLRVGWGVTGQQDLGGNLFPYMAVYRRAVQGSYYPSITGQAGANGQYSYLPTMYPGGYDPKIKWEETTTYNAGVDMAFLNNRITASVDWYLRESRDLLAHVTVPIGAATTNELDRNIGTLRNLGLEFTIGARPIVTKDFTWSIDYNVAWNKNEITKLNDNPEGYVLTGGIPGPTGSTGQIHKAGYPAYSFYLYEQIYDDNGNPIEGVYVDQNADGQISDADKVIRHQKDPKVTMTLNNNFSYKNWDLGFVLRANLGNYVYNGVAASRTNYNGTYGYGLSNLLESDFYFDQEQTLSDYYLRNASFLRCDNITLGYTWDNLINNKLRLRLFAAVQNPFVITKYDGIDPEVFGGIDNSVYPRPTTYSLGIVANF